MKRAALGGLWLLGCSEVVPPAPVDATPAADVVDGAVLDADASDGSPPDGSPSFCVSDAVCESGRRCCASRCVDPMSNAAHCGACGVSCAAGDHAAAACEGGVCRARCDVGYADCDGDRSNGCEAELATSSKERPSSTTGPPR